jgi:Uma2 family endonuclease
MVSTRALTAADIERMGVAGERLELIDEIPREKPGVSLRHGEIEIRLSSPLHLHVDRQGLGQVYPSDTQFTVLRDPDKILIPDLAFVRADRLPPEADRWHIAPFAPDLAVEVVSPSESDASVGEKVALYQRGGVPLVWVVVPPPRVVIVHRLGMAPMTLREGDILDGGDVVLGFRLPVADIFRVAKTTVGRRSLG